MQSLGTFGLYFSQACTLIAYPSAGSNELRRIYCLSRIFYVLTISRTNSISHLPDFFHKNMQISSVKNRITSLNSILYNTNWLISEGVCEGDGARGWYPAQFARRGTGLPGMPPSNSGGHRVEVGPSIIQAPHLLWSLCDGLGDGYEKKNRFCVMPLRTRTVSWQPHFTRALQTDAASEAWPADDRMGARWSWRRLWKQFWRIRLVFLQVQAVRTWHTDGG